MDLSSLAREGVLAELIVVAQVAAAMVLGALIGTERERAQRPAGLRTHMLVAGAAALLTALGPALLDAYGDTHLASSVGSDPLRILEAVVTGVAFLGAGTIIRSGPQDVTGLTTAASLLLAAGVGIGVAVSRWIVAIGVVVLTVATLSLMRGIAQRIAEKAGDRNEQE